MMRGPSLLWHRIFVCPRLAADVDHAELVDHEVADRVVPRVPVPPTAASEPNR
jgi:hypothetical protein